MSLTYRLIMQKINELVVAVKDLLSHFNNASSDENSSLERTLNMPHSIAKSIIAFNHQVRILLDTVKKHAAELAGFEVAAENIQKIVDEIKNDEKAAKKQQKLIEQAQLAAMQAGANKGKQKEILRDEQQPLLAQSNRIKRIQDNLIKLSAQLSNLQQKFAAISNKQTKALFKQSQNHAQQINAALAKIGVVVHDAQGQEVGYQITDGLGQTATISVTPEQMADLHQNEDNQQMFHILTKPIPQTMEDYVALQRIINPETPVSTDRNTAESTNMYAGHKTAKPASTANTRQMAEVFSAIQQAEKINVMQMRHTVSAHAAVTKAFHRSFKEHGVVDFSIRHAAKFAPFLAELLPAQHIEYLQLEREIDEELEERKYEVEAVFKLLAEYTQSVVSFRAETKQLMANVVDYFAAVAQEVSSAKRLDVNENRLGSFSEVFSRKNNGIANSKTEDLLKLLQDQAGYSPKLRI